MNSDYKLADTLRDEANASEWADIRAERAEREAARAKPEPNAFETWQADFDRKVAALQVKMDELSARIDAYAKGVRDE